MGERGVTEVAAQRLFTPIEDEATVKVTAQRLFVGVEQRIFAITGQRLFVPIVAGVEAPAVRRRGFMSFAP